MPDTPEDMLALNTMEDFDNIAEKAHVMVPHSSASSVALLPDHPKLGSDHPHPSITLVGLLQNPKQEPIRVLPDGSAPLTLIFDDFDEVQKLVGHLLGLFLSEENLLIAWNAISALGNQEQTSVFAEHANRIMDQLEAEEEGKK